MHYPHAALYSGALAPEVVSEMSKAGGILTAEDLSSYEPVQVDGMLRHFGESTRCYSVSPVIIVHVSSLLIAYAMD